MHKIRLNFPAINLISKSVLSSCNMMSKRSRDLLYVMSNEVSANIGLYILVSHCPNHKFLVESIAWYLSTVAIQLTFQNRINIIRMCVTGVCECVCVCVTVLFDDILYISQPAR